MARTENGHITDDIDGRELEQAETVHWSLDGRFYEFDTSPLNARSFRRALRDYARASRPDEHYGPAVDSHDTPRDRAHIRQWAIDNGYRLGARGPIPGEVLAAYRATRGRWQHRD